MEIGPDEIWSETFAKYTLVINIDTHVGPVLDEDEFSKVVPRSCFIVSRARSCLAILPLWWIGYPEFFAYWR